MWLKLFKDHLVLGQRTTVQGQATCFVNEVLLRHCHFCIFCAVFGCKTWRAMMETMRPKGISNLPPKKLCQPLTLECRCVWTLADAGAWVGASWDSRLSSAVGGSGGIQVRVWGKWQLWVLGAVAVFWLSWKASQKHMTLSAYWERDAAGFCRVVGVRPGFHREVYKNSS